MLKPDNSEPQLAVSKANFMRLFARHELALQNYARLIMPNWNAVDNVLQDATVTMWENRGQLRDESGFLPWGKVIMRHKCFNAVAKMRHNRLVLDDKVLGLIAKDMVSGLKLPHLVRCSNPTLRNSRRAVVAFRPA
ncbi:MAG: RNA polymerase sigma-70 factor (ECF subfamily) [Planctomycetaceae bacterium]|jgi:RNA polymerase sigma-70 factor (ECF subfamily)